MHKNKLSRKHAGISMVTFVSMAVFMVAAVAPLGADTIIVSDFNELVTAVTGAKPYDVVLMENGLYQLAGTWAVQVRTDDLTIRSLSGNRKAVVLNGLGMFAMGHHGFWVDAHRVTIADITIQNVRNHCVQTDPDVNDLKVANCILRDAGEQALKGTAPSENGIVEGCLFDYSAGIGPRYYIGGVDCHGALNWIVRGNTFRDIVSPETALAEHAIHFWNDSAGTVVENNVIIDCDRGIGFGLGSSTHTGGLIFNNFVRTTRDVGIGLESSSNTLVYNNTLYTENYTNSIEYRFPGTAGGSIVNNLTNGQIRSRDGGTAYLSHNVSDADAHWFHDASAGDLHLALAPEVLDRVVDQGTALGEVNTDIDGQARPQGAVHDLGADELLTPLPDIKANGSDGPLTVAPGENVRLTVAMDARELAGLEVDWWVLADTQVGWYHYAYQQGWASNIERALAAPLFDLTATALLDRPLPVGDYLFRFVVDHNADDILDDSWPDEVEVHVAP